MSQITQLETATQMGAVVKLTGNTGTATPDGAGNINIIDTQGTGLFTGASHTLTHTYQSAANNNVGLGLNSLASLTTGSNNTAFGFNTLAGLTNTGANVAIGSGSMALGTFTLGVGGNNVAVGNGTLGVATGAAAGNVALGDEAMFSLTTGAANIAIGQNTLGAATTAGSNVAIGQAALQTITTGLDNTVIGQSAFEFVTAGASNNIGLGKDAGKSYNGTESSNIIVGVGNLGTPGENNVMRLGPTSGGSAITSTYIAGIDGVNVGSVARVVTEASNQLGTAVITAGTNISVVAGANTITINATGPDAFVWSVITVNQTAAVFNGYFCNKAGTLALALPAISNVGDTIDVANINTGTGTQFTQAAGQQIFFAGASTTLGAGGTLTSSAVGDTLRMVCRTANTTWQVVSAIGNWTFV